MRQICKVLFWRPVILGFLFLFSCAGGPEKVPENVPEQNGSTEKPPAENQPSRAELPPEESAGELAGNAAVLNRMVALLGGGDFNSALTLFDQLEGPEAESSSIQLLRASVLFSAGKGSEGKLIVENILAKDNANADALYILSAIEAAEGKTKNQQARLEQALKYDPANTQALSGLGNIYLSNRSSANLKKAAAYFEEALKVDPDNGDALVGLASVYRFNHNRKNAERLLNAAVAKHPNWARPLHERGRLYREWGHPKEALNDLDKAKAIEPDSYFIAADRGNALLDLGRKEEALEEYNRAIRIDANIFMAYAYSAGIKFDLGDIDGAEHDFQMQIKLNPKYYYAWEGLGMTRMLKGNWTGARDAFAEMYKQAPQEWCYALLSAINGIRAGNGSDAKNFLAQAMKNFPRETKDGKRNPAWWIMRLFHDLSGDSDLVVMTDNEKNLDMKARLSYYLANYYDIRGSNGLADRYFLQVKELDRKSVPEWKLNEWTVKRRGLEQTARQTGSSSR